MEFQARGFIYTSWSLTQACVDVAGMKPGTMLECMYTILKRMWKKQPSS
jgi:hypothetical protein